MLSKVLTSFFSPGESFKSQILHSGLWAGLLNFGQRLLDILRLVILTRILLPEDFGLLGVAMIIIMGLRSFSRLGLQEALIEHPDEDVDAYLDTVWVIRVVRGTLLAVIMYGSAGAVSGFFGEPRATPIIQGMSLVVAMEGFFNPAVTYYKKNLDFHKEFAYQMSGAVSSFVVAVSAAFILGTVWALVYGELARYFVKLLLSHNLTSHTVRFSFSRDHATELFDFGRWIFASSVVYFLVTSLDDAFVGWYLGAAALGIYQVAFRLSNAPATEIAHVVGHVMFPGVSVIQDNVGRVRRLFKHALAVVSVIAVPMAVGMLLIAPEFVAVVLGNEWLPMVPVIQVFAGAGLLRALAALTGPVYRGLGMPEWNVYENSIRLIILVISIWPLSEVLGAIGAAASVLLAVGGGLLVGMYKLREVINVSPGTFIRTLTIPVLASLSMAVVVIQIKRPTLTSVVLTVIAGVLTYGTISFILLRISGIDIKEIIKVIAS
jgi:O-antigen/teichoic acid export membrane protein